jgi:hypothetical protein
MTYPATLEMLYDLLGIGIKPEGLAKDHKTSEFDNFGEDRWKGIRGMPTGLRPA